jgi:hypothetical protein
LGGDKKGWLCGVELGEVVPALVGFPAVSNHLGDCDGREFPIRSSVLPHGTGSR